MIQTFWDCLNFNISERDGIYTVFADWEMFSSATLFSTDKVNEVINYANTMGELWDVSVYIPPNLREKLNNPEIYKKQYSVRSPKNESIKTRLEKALEDFDFEEDFEEEE